MVAFNPAFVEMIGDIITVKNNTLKLGGNLYEILHHSNREEVVNRLKNISFQEIPWRSFFFFEMRFEGIKTYTTAYATPLKDPFYPKSLC